MSKGLVKSSKKKQRSYEKFLRNRNPEKKLNHKQYKTLFESLKMKSKKNNYSVFVNSYKYNIRKTWEVMKEIIGNKRFTNVPPPNFITVKNREIFDKKKSQKSFIIILLILVPTYLPLFPKAKRHSKTIFTTAVLASVPSILRT